MKNNLIEELFDKSKAYRMGIFCTYSLNIDFLENYLLKLDGVVNCTNLCLFTDRKIYNSFFDVNTISTPKWINKRYLLTPIDTNGVFHPKLYLLASDREVRIGIGSANMTREGLSSNMEIVSVFEINPTDKKYMGLLKECLRFIEELAVTSRSISAVECVREFIVYINDFLIGDEESNIHLLHNLGRSIIEQTTTMLRDCIIRSIKVISPFYDRGLAVHKFLKKIYPNADFSLYIQQGKSNFPIDKYTYDKTDTKIYLYKDQDRYIHGKAVIFETNKGKYLLTGSANYTDSAMLSKKYSANVETTLLGLVSDEVLAELIKPDGVKIVLLKEISQLTVSPIIQDIGKNIGYIDDWLVEVCYRDNQFLITINEKEELKPEYITFNDNMAYRYDYSNILFIKDINKSELNFAHIEGVNANGDKVYSSKVWIVDLDKGNQTYSKKRYYVSDPSQLTYILSEIIKNGTEEELVQYLLKFNIPLDLMQLNLRYGGLKAMESKGNVFGELMSQKNGMLKYSGMLEAVNHFLATSYNKMCAHCENVQLPKLGNFMLIFGTMFSMMEVINDYISASYRKNPIDADDWTIIREYYDVFLKYINDCIVLIWISDEEYYSFENVVDFAIEEDEQNLLGSISSFKEYIQKMGYDFQFLQSYQISKRIIKNVNIYLEKAKIKTTRGTIVMPPISQNGINDLNIIKRREILILINNFIKEMEELKAKK